MNAVALLLAVAVGFAPAGRVEGEVDEAAEARALYQRAKAEFEAGNFEAAAEAFVSAYERSGNPNLLYNAALAYEEAQDYERALAYLQRYRPLAPADEHASLDAEIRVLSKRAQAEPRSPAPEESGSPPPSDEPAAVVPPPRTTAGGGSPPQRDAEPSPPVARVYGPAAIGLTALTVAGTGLAVGFGVAAQTAKQRAYDACEVDDGATVCKDDAREASSKFRTFAAITDASIVVAAASAVALVTVIGVNAARRAKTKRTDAAMRWRPGGLGVRF